MTPNSKGKRVIVTGSASGIGAETARAFVAAGARLVGIDQDADGLQALVKELGSGASGIAADLAYRTEVETAVRDAVERLGGLDVLVNNAGIGSLARAADLDPDEWRRVLAIDLDAVFYASRIALPHLVDSKGCIVNTASISGTHADYGFTAYDSAKAGVIGLTRVMAIDYAAQGVRVNAVSPGFIATPLVAGLPAEVVARFVSCIPMKRAGEPSEVAKAILFLAGDAATYITGQNLVVDGGLLSHTGLPNLLDGPASARPV